MIEKDDVRDFVADALDGDIGIGGSRHDLEAGSEEMMSESVVRTEAESSTMSTRILRWGAAASALIGLELTTS
jgi:hypothetical protein